MIGSVLVHVVAFLAVRAAPPVPAATPSEASSPDGVTARPALRAARLRLRREEIRPPPRPTLTVTRPSVAAPPALLASLPSERVAVGRPPATGGGAGVPSPGSPGGATGDGTSPAVPRSLFPEWDPPASVRGMEVTVRVRVDARGRPTGEVELVPPTPDQGFNRRLAEKARRMEYRPALEGGVPVVGWAEITFVF